MATSNTTRKADITADIFQSTLTLTFSNGESLSLNTETLNAEIAKQAMLHGLKQKLVDAAAISRGEGTGFKSASIETKYAAVKEVFDRLTSETPTWNKVREAGAMIGQGLLVRALMQMGNKTKAQIEVFLESKTKEEKSALRKNPKVAAIIAQMQADADDSGVDSDDLLGELLDDETDDTPADETDDETDDTPVSTKPRGKKGAQPSAE